MDKIISFAPATTANVGPGYDIMGYALMWLGDFCLVEKTEKQAEPVHWRGVSGPMSRFLENLRPERNAAFVAARYAFTRLVEHYDLDFSVSLTLHKYMPIGSGLGSSSASTVAAVKGVLAAAEKELPPEDIIDALLLGEETACGTGHPDNVIPSYFGGFFLMMSENYDDLPAGEKRFHRVEGGKNLISVIVKPDVSLNTSESRAALNNHIRRSFLEMRGFEPVDILSLVRQQSIKAAEAVLSYQSNDIERLGAIMRNNDLLEIPRGSLIPRFREVKEAALTAGAYGCSIAGSGPSLVAITDDEQRAPAIRDAMIEAFGDVPSRWLISPVNNDGAVIVDDIEAFLAAGRPHTNMLPA
jgi:homoserine kinase